MTLPCAISEFKQKLESIYEKGEAKAITEIVFRHFTGTNLLSEISITAYTQATINNALERLLACEPVQYILGETFFYGRKFFVDTGVLIPRPETEELCLHAINYMKSAVSSNVIDIGTGSGCIAVTLAAEVSNSNITALDNSFLALEVAKKNAALHSTKIQFQQIDFLQANNWSQLVRYDVIISNPPYIPLREKSAMDSNVVHFEPGAALFVNDEDPLIFYRKICAFTKDHLAGNGKVFLEIHRDFASQTAEIFQKESFHAEIVLDINNNERFLIATRRP